MMDSSLEATGAWVVTCCGAFLGASSWEPTLIVLDVNTENDESLEN